MQPIHSWITRMSAGLAAIALTMSPARALATEARTNGRSHAHMAAARLRESDDGGSGGSVTARSSGSDDGGSDDSVTTRTSPIKPVGGVGPLLGGGSSGSAAKRTTPNHGHAHRPPTRMSGAPNHGHAHHPPTRMSGAANRGSDN